MPLPNAEGQMQDMDFSESVSAQQAAAETLAERRLLIVSLIVSGSLYLLATAILGLMLGNRMAWGFSIVALGVTYLSAFWQITAPPEIVRGPAVALVAISILAGFASGIALLMG